MQRRRGFAPILIVLIVTGLLLAGGIWYYEATRTPSSQPNANQTPSLRKIAFLKSREVWVANEDGTGAHKITNTSSSVSTFTASPDSTYLEYSDGASYVAFVDLSNEKIIKTITVKDFSPVPHGYDGQVNFVAWISGSEFEVVLTDFQQGVRGDSGVPAQDLIVDLKNPSVPVFATSTRSSFNGAPSYSNASVHSTVDWEYSDGSSVGDAASLAAGMYWGLADFSSQNQYIIYQIDPSTIFYGILANGSSSVTFSTFNPSTKRSVSVGSWNSPSVIDAQLNHKKDNFAILRQNLPLGASTIGNELWLYNNGTPLKIYIADSQNDGFFRWSYDDKYIALRLGDNTPMIVIIDVSNTTNPKVVKEIDIPGDVSYRGMQWTRDDRLLFTRGTDLYKGNIYEYDLQSDAATVIATSSYQPFAL